MKWIDTNLIPSSIINTYYGKAEFDQPSYLVEQGYKYIHLHEINYIYTLDAIPVNGISEIFDRSFTNITSERITNINPAHIEDYSKSVRPENITINGNRQGFSTPTHGLFIDLKKSQSNVDKIEFYGYRRDVDPLYIDFRVKIKATAITKSDIENNHLNIANILKAYKNRYTTTAVLIAV